MSSCDAEGAVVSREHAPMYLMLVRYCGGTSRREYRMSTTFGELTSRKLSDFEYQGGRLCGCGPWRWCKGVGKIHMDKGRVGEEGKGKETDGCPLIGMV
jgi:hypothetical protein